MALGGGIFTTQNKVLPGAYINYISKTKANISLSDRGIVTIPLELNWGKEEEVITITNEDFEKNCFSIFGYDVNHENMKGLRDLFLNARTLYAYRLNTGVKATNTYATAKYSGTRGNDLKIVITANSNDPEKLDVSTYLNTILVDIQTVASAPELVDNDYVTFKDDATLQATSGTPLSGGTNGTITGANYQNYFDKIESYSFNVMGITSTTDSIKALAANFCKRMREEIGSKFQVVLHNYNADYEGVINLINNTTSELVYWVSGLQSACEVNKSCLNALYDGEYEVNTDYTQVQLETAIKEGKFVLHAVGDTVRVLKDINSLVTLTENKNEIFKENQTIRIADLSANDIATIFNTRYLGTIQNDEDGRTSLKNDIVTYFENLQTMRAIENFDEEAVEVSAGDNKGSVVINVALTIVNVMAQLYMTVTID